MLCDRPAPDHRGDCARREDASASAGSPLKQEEHGDSRRRPRGPRVAAPRPSGFENGPCMRVKRDQVDGRERPGDQRGDERAVMKYRSRSGVWARRASLTRNTLAR